MYATARCEDGLGFLYWGKYFEVVIVSGKSSNTLMLASTGAGRVHRVGAR